MANLMVKRWQMFVVSLWIVCLALFLAIMTTPIYTVIAYFEQLGQSVHLTLHQVIQEYHRLWYYEMAPWRHYPNLQYFRLSAHAWHHFQDVKLYMMLLEGIVVLGVPCMFMLKRWYKQHQLWQWIIPLKGMLLLPIPLLLVMGMGFDRFFYWCHMLLFRNHFWQFEPQIDPIILVFPDTFFLVTVVVSIVNYYLFFGILYYIAKQQLKGK